MRRRNVLAFPTRFLIRSVYPVSRSRLVIVVVCGIPCRLAHRLVVRLARSSRFLFAFFCFRLGASRSSSRPLFLLLRLVVLLPYSLRSSSLIFRSSSSLSSSSFVSCPCCLRCRFHSRHPSLPVLRRSCLVGVANCVSPMSHMKQPIPTMPR